MANQVTSLSALESKLKSTIDSVLGNEIMNDIVRFAQSEGQRVVYGAYYNIETHAPNMYVRRGKGGGGLLDKESFVRDKSKPLTLKIINTAEPNQNFPGRKKVKNLAQLVEQGNGHGGKYSYHPGEGTEGDFRAPRPFMQSTQDGLVSGNVIPILMKEYLTKRGLTVEW